jgi:hypothetical protein
MKGYIMTNETYSLKRIALQTAVYISVVVVVGTLATNATDKLCSKIGI